MSENKIPVITLSESGLHTTEPVTLEYLANIFCAAITGYVRNIQTAIEANEKLSDKDREVINRQIFDGLNAAYSRQLEICFPEIDLHPEMTDEILKEVLDIQTKRVIEQADELYKQVIEQDEDAYTDEAGTSE